MGALFAFLTWPQLAIITTVGMLVLWPLLYLVREKLNNHRWD